MNDDIEATTSEGSVGESIFLRLKGGVWDPPGDHRVYFFEVEPGGYVPREVVFDSFGTPTYVTRPGEYPIADYPAPPGSALFDQQFGSGDRIARAEFEAAYGRAIAVLDDEST